MVERIIEAITGYIGRKTRGEAALFNPKRISLGTKEWDSLVELPAQGLFSVSDHFITTADGFYILKDRKDGIEDHLEESIKFLIESYYKGASPPQLKTMYHKGDEGWSTSGSDLGCGDRGQRMLTVAEEVWSGSMMFQKGSKPKSGTKFKVTHIVNNKGVSCIVQMGFLSAPSSSEYLGSLSTEVHTVLGSTNKTRLQIDYCDQSLKLGPV